MNKKKERKKKLLLQREKKTGDMLNTKKIESWGGWGWVGGRG